MTWRLARFVASAAILLGATRASGATTSDPEVVALLERLLNGRETEKSRAIERLRAVGTGRAGPALRELVENGSDRERVVATEALTVVRDPASARALEKALNDPDWEVRRNAAQALGFLAGRSPKRLAVCAEKEAHVRVQRACVDAVAKRGGASSSLVVAATTSTDLDTRLKALGGLAQSMDAAAAKKLRPLLEDATELVQFAAARALSWSGDAVGRRFLTKHVAGDDAERAIRAIHALGDVPRSWAADLVAGALGSTDPEIRHAAALALESRGDGRGRRQLTAWLGGTDPVDATFARRELDRLGAGSAP